MPPKARRDFLFVLLVVAVVAVGARQFWSAAKASASSELGSPESSPIIDRDSPSPSASFASLSPDSSPLLKRNSKVSYNESIRNITYDCVWVNPLSKLGLGEVEITDPHRIAVVVDCITRPNSTWNEPWEIVGPTELDLCLKVRGKTICAFLLRLVLNKEGYCYIDNVPAREEGEEDGTRTLSKAARDELLSALGLEWNGSDTIRFCSPLQPWMHPVKHPPRHFAPLK